MKFSFVSAVAALAMAATLAGCGGKAQYTVQGTITNLNNSGLVLTYNGGNDLVVPSGATTFAFSKQISYGTDYTITVKTQPDHMTCAWYTSNTGSAGHNVEIQATLQCVQNSYNLSGQYTGVTAAADGTARTVVLVNGNTSVTLSSATATAGDFSFGTVADGQAYGVTVIQPTNGLSCTIANGTGVMHETAVSNLLVTCVSQ